jgi:ribosome-binding factor A
MIAGIPNLNSTVLSACLPTREILNRLLEKCTTPVNAIAMSIGKKTAKTGIRIVPRPKPEKKVSIAVKKAARQIIKISILMLLGQK